MARPRCAFCGKEIEHNQHYFIMMGRTVCREDALKIRAKRYEVKSEDSSNSNGNNPIGVADLG